MEGNRWEVYSSEIDPSAKVKSLRPSSLVWVGRVYNILLNVQMVTFFRAPEILFLKTSAGNKSMEMIELKLMRR